MRALKSLTWLFAFLVMDLRNYCEANIPLASGIYLPHHQYKSSIESAEEGGHLFEHLAHEITKVTVQYLPSWREVLRVTGLVIHQVPLLNFGLAVADIISTHHTIHKAKYTVGMLRNFSEDLRNVLYHYVIASTMLSLATRITTNTLIEHPAALEHPLSVEQAHSRLEKLAQWYALLLIESIVSLDELPRPEELPGLQGLPKDIPSLKVLATHWCESIAKKFLQPGAYMRNLLQINEGTQYTQEDMGVALKTQQIFDQPNKNSSYSYLATSLEPPFRDPCEVVFSLLNELEDTDDLKQMLPWLQFSSDEGRMVLPCYPVTEIITQHMIQNNANLLLLINFPQDNQRRRAIYFEGDRISNRFQLRPLTEKVKTKPCLVMYGASRVNPGYEGQFLAKLLSIGAKDIVLFNNASHPQYSGSSLAAYREILTLLFFKMIKINYLLGKLPY